MRALIWAGLLVPACACAHEGAAHVDSAEWAVALLLAVSAVLYVRGAHALWRAAGRGHGVKRGEAAAFAAGWLAIAAALFSPIDRWGEQLFSAHMVQHEMLMLVAAPLLVLGRPLATWMWALPPASRVALGAALRYGPWRRAWVILTAPLTAWALHAATVWVWHAPALFTAARVHDGVHALQHTSFLITALLFWWALMKPRRDGVRAMSAVLYLFTTMLHTGALGALFVFADTVFYPVNGAGAAAWGLTALEDQQLGGLIMWIPGGLVYVAVAIALFASVLIQPAPQRRAVYP